MSKNHLRTFISCYYTVLYKISSALPLIFRCLTSLPLVFRLLLTSLPLAAPQSVCNTFRSYTACALLLRIKHSQRLVDDQFNVGAVGWVKPILGVLEKSRSQVEPHVVTGIGLCHVTGTGLLICDLSWLRVLLLPICFWLLLLLLNCLLACWRFRCC